MYYKYLSDEKGRSQNGNLKYLDQLREIARQNRKNPTEAEKIFWENILQNDQMNYRFLRQKPINKFILDFYCSKLLLAIEIDGGSHQNKNYLDKQRDIFLTKYHIKTVRYTNDQVLKNINQIREDLIKIIKEREKLIFPLLLSKEG